MREWLAIILLSRLSNLEEWDVKSIQGPQKVGLALFLKQDGWYWMLLLLLLFKLCMHMLNLYVWYIAQ